MPTLVITRGYPGCGKTTWANKWVAEDPKNRMNSNRDDIRAMLGIGAVGTHSEEKSVTAIQQSLLDTAVRLGKSIALSDTNLREKFVKGHIRWADKNGYDVEIVDFKVDIDEVIRRNDNREDKVPESVIKSFVSRFPYSRWADADKLIADALNAEGKSDKYTPYRNDPSNPDAIIVDIDGTLAHHNNARNPLDFSKVSLDTVDESIRDLSNMYYDKGVRVIVVSGRSDVCKDDTVKWLDDNGIKRHDLFMRNKQGKDWVIKDEIIREHIEDNYHVLFCLDDRNQVVDHNRAMGYKVLQVEPGDF